MSKIIVSKYPPARYQINETGMVFADLGEEESIKKYKEHFTERLKQAENDTEYYKKIDELDYQKRYIKYLKGIVENDVEIMEYGVWEMKEDNDAHKIHRITERRYEELFDCLPPYKIMGNAFFVGEEYKMSERTFCYKENGNFYMTVLDTKKDIQEQLKDREIIDDTIYETEVA